MPRYSCIEVDPPWQMPESGTYNGQAKDGKRSRHEKPRVLPYKTMTIPQLEALPIGDLAEEGCHLWLWATNAFLIEAGLLLKHWGFNWLGPIVWVKSSGYGHYIVHRTEFLLLGYYKKCRFNRLRYFPNAYELEDEDIPEGVEPIDYRYEWPRVKKGFHSKKPRGSYDLIEAVSPGPRLEIFARPSASLFSEFDEDWTRIGDGVDGRPIEQSIANLMDYSVLPEGIHGSRGNLAEPGQVPA